MPRRYARYAARTAGFGGSVKSNAFFLPEPIDAGLFAYDLYFERVNSGFFELRSFTGPGALLLPQLVTSTQDIWHQGSSTWFDRTADLRVLLNGGAPPPYGGDGKLDAAEDQPSSFVPAIWVKGSGTWLEQEDSASTTAYGRTYRYNLNRDLDVMNFETGIDLDVLIGMLGPTVAGDHDARGHSATKQLAQLRVLVGCEAGVERVARNADQRLAAHEMTLAE